MAKRKIIWSNRAIKRFYGILESNVRRNKTTTYSDKLYRLIRKEVKILLKFPEIGLKTTEETIRGLIIGDYIVCYEVTEDRIIFHTIWDYKQDLQTGQNQKIGWLQKNIKKHE